MDAVVEQGRGAQGRGKGRKPAGLTKRKRKRKMMMRLHMLRGSPYEFSGNSGGAGGGGSTAMDASVWSRLPDDMIWRVLGFLPAAKRFQLHSVCHKWRQELTSPNFRIRKGKGQQQRVLACVTPVDAYSCRSCKRSSSSSSKVMKVVDVNLATFVPSWFWNPHKKGCLLSSYSVVAAWDGLVCICNTVPWDWDGVCKHVSRCECDPQRLAPVRFCVLNPVTRTCVVLPPALFGPSVLYLSLGWLPRSATALTMCMWKNQYNERVEVEMEVTTCYLHSGGRWTVLHNRVVPRPADPTLSLPPVVAQCGGETFWYHAGRLQVLAPSGYGPGATEASRAKRLRLEEQAGGGGAERRMLVEVADAVAGPSVALLGLDAADIEYNEKGAFLVAHRGAIFFVAQLVLRGLRWHPSLTAGVWRLARHRMAWEPVSLLDRRHAERLVQIGEVKGNGGVSGAFVVHDLLCCQFAVLPCGFRLKGLSQGFVLGFDQDAR